MGINFKERFENHMDAAEIITSTDRIEKIDACYEDEYSDDFDQLCDNVEKKFTATTRPTILKMSTYLIPQKKTY